MHLQVALERQASITIQAAWRGRQQRRRLAACHLAAARIQASFLARQLRVTTIHLQVCSLRLLSLHGKEFPTLGAKHSYCNSHAYAYGRWHLCHHHVVQHGALWKLQECTAWTYVMDGQIFLQRKQGLACQE